MGKKRKTYKEKIISDLRRKVYTLEGTKAVSFKPEKIGRSISKPTSTSVATVLQNPAKLGQSQYPYLLKDITKTGILTASIIAVQIVLFVVLKNKLLVLPGVTY